MQNKKLIVVGVDGSEGSALALRWALDEAQSRGDSITAVATWQWLGTGEGVLDTSGLQTAQEFAVAGLDDAVDSALADWEGTPPDITRKVVQGRPADALLQAAEGADLLVVGSHGHGRLRHVTMGSVSEACMQKATCPVVVVPLPHHQRRHHKRADAMAG